MNTIQLSITTPNGVIFSNHIKSVTIPGADGEFGVLPGHADLLSLLKEGVVEVELKNGKKEYLAIDWGYAKINENHIDMIVDRAVSICEDDEGEIAKSLQEAEYLLQKVCNDKKIVSSLISKIELNKR